MRRANYSNVNPEIRSALSDKGLHIWNLAEAAGCCEVTMVRRLRKELSNDEKERYLKLIEAMQCK